MFKRTTSASKRRRTTSDPNGTNRGPNEDDDNMSETEGEIGQLANQTGSASGSGNFQNLTCEQMFSNQFIICSNGNDPEKDADRPSTVQDEIEIKIKKLHTRLALRLDKSVTPEQMKNIRFFFSNSGAIKESEMDKMTEFKDVWKELEKRGDIRPQEYTVLEDAFEATNSVCHITTIREFRERMDSATGVYKGWDMRESEVIDTYENLVKYIKGYTSPMEQGLSKGVVFHNAVFGLIDQKGGEMRLANGSFKLRVPSNAIDTEVIFSAFRAPPEKDEQHLEPHYAFKQKSKQDFCANGNDFVRCSFPYRLGPSHMMFNCPVFLTIRDFSLPNPSLGHDLQTGGMSIYRKEDENDNWESVGSCFSEDNLASFCVTHFSVYVLGRPLSQQNLPLLNVHILVESPAEHTYQRVVLMLNENSFIEEYINRNDFNVECETSLRLDPKCDMVAYYSDKNKFTTKLLGRLSMDDIGNLGEKYACLLMPTKGYYCGLLPSYESITLEQGGVTILELPCNQAARRREIERCQKLKSPFATRYQSARPFPPLSSPSSEKIPGVLGKKSDNGGGSASRTSLPRCCGVNNPVRVLSDVAGPDLLGREPKSSAVKPGESQNVIANKDERAYMYRLFRLRNNLATVSDVGEAYLRGREPKSSAVKPGESQNESTEKSKASVVQLIEENAKLRRENASLKQQNASLNKKLTAIHSLSEEEKATSGQCGLGMKESLLWPGMRDPPVNRWASSTSRYTRAYDSSNSQVPYQGYQVRESQSRDSPLITPPPSSPGSDSGYSVLSDQGSRFNVAHLQRVIQIPSPQSERGYSPTSSMSSPGEVQVFLKKSS